MQLNQMYQRNAINNNSTIKKDKTLSNRLIRFNQQVNEKQNVYNHSNLIANKISSLTTVGKKQALRNNTAQIFCANHPDKTPEFMVTIELQTLYYCRKCATQIASQGFDVYKLQLQHNSVLHDIPSSIPQALILRNASPSRGSQSGQEQYHNQFFKRSELIQFTKNLGMLKKQYSTKSQQLSNIAESFQIQKQTLNTYYDELIQYIEQVKHMHLQAIEDQGLKTVQLCQIQKGQVQQTVGEIDQMIYDIQANIEAIVNQIGEESYIECFSFYKQKQGIFSHRLEQLGSDTKPWPCSSDQEINSKIETFKNFVNQLHQIEIPMENHQN